MKFDDLLTRMVAARQWNTPSSWASHRRALAFGLIGVFSFSTLLWLAHSLQIEQTVFRPKSGELVHDTDTPWTDAQSPYAGVVIETTETINLVPLMLHFANLLGPTWPIILFTMQSSWETPPSQALRRALRDGRVRIHYLPRNTDLSTAPAVSTFLASPWLWERLAGLDRVLLFQTDSVLCAKAPGAIDDWVHWDFVGAPIGGEIPPSAGRGYNGGLSLRNPALFLEIARQGGFDPYIDEPRNLAFEDQWFYDRLARRNDTRLPTIQQAKKFAVETVYYETPLGFHQPQRWQSAYMDDIEAYCPEVNMMLKRRIE